MFEDILETLADEKQQQSFLAKLLYWFSSFLITFVFIIFLFSPSIKNGGDFIREFIAFIFISCIYVLMFLVLTIIIEVLIFMVKNRKKVKVEKIYKMDFFDEIKNRLQFDEKIFFKKIERLKTFEKSDLEQLKDWLDYRIKFEGMIVAGCLMVLKLLPDMKMQFDTLFQKGGFLDSAHITNPVSIAIELLPLEILLFTLLLMIALYASFIPRRIKIFYTLKFAAIHGYHKPEK